MRGEGIAEWYPEIEFIGFPEGSAIFCRCRLRCFFLVTSVVFPGRLGCRRVLAEAFSYEICPEHRDSCQRRVMLRALPLPELILVPADGAFRRCHCLFDSPAPPGHRDHVRHGRLDG